MKTGVNTKKLTYKELLKKQNYTEEKLQEANQTIKERDIKVAQLKAELKMYKNIVHGTKHERFIRSSVPSGQLVLALNMEPPKKEEKEKERKQQVSSYERKKKEAKENNEGLRMILPAHIPRRTTIIEPKGDLTGYVKIGEEVNERLEVIPPSFVVERTVRNKYAKLPTNKNEDESSVLIGELPSRIIDKGIAGPGLLAHILVNKYMDHLPLHRQLRQYETMGVKIPMSTITDWVNRASQTLEGLYEALKKQVLNSGYLQVDETTIKVLDKKIKGRSHLGYYWLYLSPLDRLVLFDYQPGRSSIGPATLLADFKGYLQTDGYKVYEMFKHQRDVIPLNCFAHARRPFFDAFILAKRHNTDPSNTDPTPEEHVLIEIQKLYAIEREADEQQLSFDQRKEIRQTRAAPILKKLHEWMLEKYPMFSPKMPMGKALSYSLQRWEKLTRYLEDGKLKIDNNLVENAVRPLAIGRKNYLFAGSHAAAQRAAMVYSLLSACKAHQVNPYEWLRDVFTKLPDYPINRIEELLPHRWSKTDSQKP